MASVRRVCVLGAGVVGLSSAVCILEQCPGVEVTILADKFSPYTTSDISGGLYNPCILGDTDPELTREWCSATWDHLYRLFDSQDAGKVGCQLISGYFLAHADTMHVDLQDQRLGYRQLSAKELSLFPFARWGVFCTSLQIEVTLYLHWLMDRFKFQGGKINQGKVNSLNEVTDQYDVVVNCTGLGSHDLLGDTEAYPIRGQVFRCQAPWVKHFYQVLDPPDRNTYVLPGARSVVVGGTAQQGDWNTEVDEADSQDIRQRALTLLPSLKEAKVTSHSAGLRPGRTSVRLEKQLVNTRGTTVPVVHNYGHGGYGVTLHWGCALHTARLVKESFLVSRL